MSDRDSSSWALDSSSSMSLAKSPGCEACGAEVFADYRHFCLRCGLRLPLTPSSPSPSPSQSPSPSPPSPSPRDLQILRDLRRDLQVLVDGGSGMAEANTQRDSDDEWLEELLGQPGSSLTRHQTATAAVSRVGAAASAPGRASHVAAGPSFRALPAAATSKRTLRAPPSIEAIKRRRLEQEELDSERERLWQKERWDRRLGRRQVGSPDARRSGRKSSGLSLERCSSRSRSPGVCERIARRETRLLPEVIWDYHICMLDPDIELIVNQAKAAIHSCQGPTLFYVGVSRYLMRRCLGGDALSFEQAHSSKWARLHVLSTRSHNVGDSEDALIKILRQDFGANCCVNIRNGGGGASRCKPSLLYICGEPTR